jgi:hypothetical protein
MIYFFEMDNKCRQDSHSLDSAFAHLLQASTAHTDEIGEVLVVNLPLPFPNISARMAGLTET